MNSLALIRHLERAITVLPAMVNGIADADVRWRPSADSWSILEIVSHLADEEAEDFRPRLRLTLEDAGAPWPPIDPVGWAVQRDYQAGELTKVMDRFLAERRASLAWLTGLGEVDWAVTHQHPKAGALAAGDLLVAWTAHDTLHLRQIARRLHQLIQRDGGGFSPAYAGQW